MEMRSDHKAPSSNLSSSTFSPFLTRYCQQTVAWMLIFCSTVMHKALHVQLARHTLSHCHLLNRELLQALDG